MNTAPPFTIYRPLPIFAAITDHYRPKKVREALDRAARIAAILAPDDPMLFVRPQRLRNLQQTGHGLN